MGPFDFPGFFGRTLISRAQLTIHHWGVRSKKRDIPVPEKPFAVWKKEGPGERHEPKRRRGPSWRRR